MNLTRIYTRTGDQGQTRLANNESVPKTDPRLSAYGTVDEANSALGWALAVPDIDPGMADVLTRVQNDLFDAGADLATPLDASSDRPALRVEQAWVDRLEDWCDTFGEDLPSLRSFLLPGGTELSARLNIVRTIVRRAEREAWAAGEETSVNPLALQYLNRLSDLLFILGRHANRLAGVDEVLWVPAGDHA